MLESVSALMDGEASELELRRILNASESDESLRSTWSRYQQVSSLMRGESGVAAGIDLSAAIRDVIEDEAVPVTAADSGRATRPAWLANLSRVGIAASVAAVVVLTAQVVNLGQAPAGGEPNLAQPLAVQSGAGAAASSSEERLLQSGPVLSQPFGYQAPSIAARTVSASAGRAPSASYQPVNSRAQLLTTPAEPPLEVQLYLQQVMEMHAGQAATNGGQGLLPYARVPVSQE
jgi:sigma-E factor negative regulatory protein RseA